MTPTAFGTNTTFSFKANNGTHPFYKCSASETATCTDWVKWNPYECDTCSDDWTTLDTTCINSTQWRTIVEATCNKITQAAVSGWYSSCGSDWVKVVPVIPSPIERLKTIIAERHAPQIIVPTRRPLVIAGDDREVCARQTIRRILGEDEFRDYMKNGFVSVRGKSGLVYQIYPDHGITRVYNCGVMVERLCVVLNGKFPPTDSLIMRYLLILNDEQDFRKHAVVHQVIKPTNNIKVADNRSLPEIYRELKAVG